MHFSRSFKSSQHCSPSPDGQLVATLAASTLTLRSITTLQTIDALRLPASLPSHVSAMAWSPSSSRILVCAADQIHVFSVTDPLYHATVSNTDSPAGKPPVVQFGARDTEVLLWAPFGLKLTVFDLAASKAVELANPKFSQSASASRGFSLRPGTGHLALLTRVGGKDMISIHDPLARQVQRSWYPDTVDAQGLMWTPDGQWLLLWESPAHGHRLLLHTADGQVFRSLGAANLSPGPDAALEPGIKLCRPSPDSELCAVSDHSRRVAVLGTAAWRVQLWLQHPRTIVPKDTVQVWQEQLSPSSEGCGSPVFLRTTQMVSPPGRPSDGRTAPEPKPGCSAASFDASSTLLATRLDDSPGTLWIWDVAAAELRAVLIFYSAISFSWHPFTRELLLITCQDDASGKLSFVWDPLSNGPNPVVLQENPTPNSQLGAKTHHCAWIRREADPPLLFVSDAQNYALASISDAEQLSSPWQQTGDSEWTGAGLSAGRDLADTTSMSASIPEDISALDDTFSFRTA